jgi:hypothetical protein
MHGEFTPLESGLGGLLVGLSAATVLLVHGCVRRALSSRWAVR